MTLLSMKPMVSKPNSSTEEPQSSVGSWYVSADYANDFAEGPDGKLSVKKTEKNFEFFTKSKVGRVGWVHIAVYLFSTSDNLQSYARRSRR